MVESVDSLKLANKLNSECERIQRQERLRVLVQVHTGDEASKNGVEVKEVASLVDHIISECPKLHFYGLMAMGKLHDREGFREVVKLRDELLPQSGLDVNQFILSMGTSQDFEAALEEGATEVRLGTTIFGARNYP